MSIQQSENYPTMQQSENYPTMQQSENYPLPKFKIQIGHKSNKGTGRQNQDDIFVIQESDAYIFGVADGHGYYGSYNKDRISTGKIASSVSKKSTQDFVLANTALLSENPVEFLEKCFECVQENVRQAFIEDIQQNEPNSEVSVNEDGIPIARKHTFQNFSNMTGGSMLSIAILKNGVLYIANVGDCDGLLCAKTPILKQTNIKYEKDTAQEKTLVYTDETLTENLVITRDHSPDNVEEYKRIRGSAKDPSLMFIYDNQEREKPMCEPIFEDTVDGPALRPDIRFYYKNVSKDKATYITTPFDAQYRDALASTRSIADFNLNKYGLTPKPEIQSVDLNHLLHGDPLCLVLCSDGVWDNWITNHVQKFVMDPSCLNAIATKPDGAQRVVDSFMNRNDIFGKKNFGTSYDDASCVIMYITPQEEEEDQGPSAALDAKLEALYKTETIFMEMTLSEPEDCDRTDFE
jgi:serine/threonine protein phosphatase PrpC